MAAKTFCLLFALCVFQTARALSIEDILSNPSKIIDDLKHQISLLETDIQNGVADLLAKAENVFGDLGNQIQTAMAAGEAAGQCLQASQDDLTSLLASGTQDVTACGNKVLTDVGPLAQEVEVAVADITNLVAECGSGSGLGIVICLAEYVSEATKTVGDVTKALADIPLAYNSLQSDVQSCDARLTLDTQPIEALLSTCL